MKEKAAKRNKRGTVLLSGTASGRSCSGQVPSSITQWTVLQRPYDGPWKVTRVINPSTYESANERGKIAKVFKRNVIKNLFAILVTKNYATVPTAKELPQVLPCLCMKLGLRLATICVVLSVVLALLCRGLG
jgi:hypothetical protein